MGCSHMPDLNFVFRFMWGLCILYVVNALAVYNEEAAKKILLNNLTPEEHHMVFGDVEEPVFHLIKPIFLPHNDDRSRKLIFSDGGDLYMEFIVNPTTNLLAPHLQQGGIFIDGQLVTQDSGQRPCHYRSSNQTHVVAINDCHLGTLEGMFITPDEVGTLHVVPSRLLNLLHKCFSQQPSSSSDETVEYPLHIFHLATKDALPSNLRFKRSIINGENDDDDEQVPLKVCATEAKHDMSEKSETRTKRAMRPPLVRSVAELLPDFQDDFDNSQDFSLLNDSEGANTRDVPEQAPLAVVRRKTVELAVFCDDDLYSNFPQKLKDTQSAKLIDYVLTLVNAIQGIYHQEELQGYIIDLLVVRLDIQTTSSGPSKSGGDIGAYLSSFCDWQQNRNPQGESNPQHWDHAIMLSGLDLHSSGNPSVIGLAWVSGMCRPSISCTMNEGRSFMTVYVVAHEMGHNLGMNHDGQGEANGCDSNKYIMSPSVGPGKTTWSQCSIQVIHNFLRQSTCLDDGEDSQTGFAFKSSPRTSKARESVLSTRGGIPLPQEMVGLRDRTPGHKFSLTEQCQAMHGRDFYPALTKFDLCDYLYCTNGVVTKPAHPPLEGSPCGPHRMCLGGKCRPEIELAKLAHLYGFSTAARNQTADRETSVPPKQPPKGSEGTTETSVPGTKDENCTCSEIPPSLYNVSMELCPYLAPVFQPLFNCENICHDYDLYFDSQKGKMFKITEGSTALEDLTKDCSQANGENLLASVNLQGINITEENSDICNALPKYIHSVVGCSNNGQNPQNECIPQHIILAMTGLNVTYALQENIRDDRSVEWNGQNYAFQSFSGNRDIQKEDAKSLLHMLSDFKRQVVLSDFLNCDRAKNISMGLKNTSEEICLFLAPGFHHLFNCSTYSGSCENYVFIVNLEKNFIMKAPKVRVDDPQKFVCDKCPKALKDANSFFKKTFLKAAHDVSVSGLCQLLPTAWLKMLPDCSRLENSRQAEDDCTPNTIVIQGSKYSFTYEINDSGDKRRLNQSSIEWRGKPYSLKGINYTTTSEESLAFAYDLDLTRKSVSKFVSDDLISSPPRGKFRSAFYETQDTQEDLQLTETPKYTNVKSEGANYTAFENLQDYFGQKDVFLGLNAASTMPRTVVGQCSVTCGQGTRPVNVECVDVLTEKAVDDDTCQGYVDTEIVMEPCFMPPCAKPRWSVGDWGPCSESCGQGVQYRDVTCVMDVENREEKLSSIRSTPHLVVDKLDCEGKAPHSVRDCEGQCAQPVWCAKEDCLDYQDVQISRDFDYQ